MLGQPLPRYALRAGVPARLIWKSPMRLRRALGQPPRMARRVTIPAKVVESGPLQADIAGTLGIDERWIYAGAGVAAILGALLLWRAI